MRFLISNSCTLRIIQSVKRIGYLGFALKQPFLRAVFTEVPPQLFQQLGRKQRVAAFLALAHDTHGHRFAVDVLGCEVQQFAPPQSGRVNQRNHAAVLDVGQLVKDALYLVPAQHFRQCLVLLGPCNAAVVLPFPAFHLLSGGRCCALYGTP